MRKLKIFDAEVVILADEADLATEAARRTVATLGEALAERGTAHVALTGGSSAVALYRDLAAPPWRDAIAWDQVHFWWGDERYVPRDHPESNAGLAYRTLFAVAAFSGESGIGGSGADVEAGDEPGLVVDADKVHPIETEEAIAHSAGPAWAAQAYADDIGRIGPGGPRGVPAFDLVMVGVGPDGHTLSVFPGGPGIDDSGPIVLAIDAPDVEPRLPRVTLPLRILPVARSVLVMSAGAAKSDVVASVLGPTHDVATWPAQAAVLPNSTWLLDEEAARGIRERAGSA